MSSDRKFRFYDQPYIVEVRKNREPNGEWIPFVAYDDYDTAVEHTNRIDRHRDVRLTKLPTDWRSVLDRKFDALAVYISRL